MKLGSLFDGSGGFPLAGSLCGITPIWASEIEPYPIAVTTSRFPYMKHIGDVSKVSGAEVEPVDVLTFGSPCQDLSIAGKRAGLKHKANGDDETTRSGLFMEAVRIIKEMRQATNGLYPTFALWENVPGAFSSNKGEDFRVVLEELIKIVEPGVTVPAAGKNGWPYADAYVGAGWSIAYRTLDAQYWGVPQRRRRIYLVADFRGERAPEILFEREGLRGYFEKGRTPWQGITADAQRCVGTDDREGTKQIALRAGAGTPILDDQGGNQITVRTDGKAPTLRAEMHGNVPCVMEADKHGTVQDSSSIFAYSFDSLSSNSMKSKNPYSGCRQVDVAKTLDCFDPNPSKNQGGIAVVECYDARGNGDGKTASTIAGDNESHVTDYSNVICLQGNGIDRADTAGCNGKGWTEDVSYTLNTIDRPAVAFATTGPTYIVRRLTPTECARLQGFPDTWGHPDHKDNLTDDEYRFWQDVRNTYATINGRQAREYTRDQILTWYNSLHTDSSEYKMWGNGIALPTALYVMQGIAEKLQQQTSHSKETTMERLTTVQTHHNLNAVYRTGDPGPGGAHHDYYIYPADCDPETTELPMAVIEFRRGPRKDPEARQGVLDCDLLEIVRDRLTEFEAGSMACWENKMALRCIEIALMLMFKRVEDRAERQVLGTMDK